MRFLIDNALSPVVSRTLAQAGYDAIHVRDIGLSAAADSTIFDRAAQERRIVVSADTDFGTLLALRQTRFPSLILFRKLSTRKPAFQAKILLLNLPQIRDVLEEGCVVVLDEGRIRVRRLPFFS